jgi:hypothetical protein
VTTPRITPFRAGGTDGPRARTRFANATAGPAVLLADVSEFEPDVADAAYLDWSKAIVIRAAYGTSHDDHAWYGGQRRDLLHAGGARFVGIYQYLVAGQDGGDQADAMHGLVGPIRQNEVIIGDFEEGGKPMLTAWYNRMLALGYPHQQLWTYSGLDFGQANGALPVEWVAAYGQGEPSTPHKLWQFTSTFPVPGVGSCDCSVFHGTIDQLAALTYQGTAPAAPPPAGPAFSQPQHVTVQAGDSTVEVLTCVAPAHGGPVDHYLVDVHTGSYPSDATRVHSYPRFMRAAPHTFGSLEDIASKTHMTCRVTAVDRAGNTSAYTDAGFEMP